MKNQKFKLTNIFLPLFLIILWVKAVVFLDPDFGWRIRTGFNILKNGIPRTDLYSYTMPSFPWVDHAWLTDVIVALGYRTSGIIGLAFIFSVLALGAIFISSSISPPNKDFRGFRLYIFKKKIDISLFGIPTFLLTLAIVLPFFGVRAQVITWLFTAVLWSVLLSQRLLKRFGFLIPPFFILWANLHGGFAGGLLILYLFFFIRFVRNRKIDLTHLSIIAVSTIGTFINPYGGGVFREVWSSISDNSLRWEIVEWQPTFVSFDAPTLSLMVLSSMLIYNYKTKLKSEEITVFLILLVQAVLSVRNVPIWAIVAAPITSKSINLFYGEVTREKNEKEKNIKIERFRKVYIGLGLCSLCILCFEAIFAFRGAISLSENNFYPVKAIAYLKRSVRDGNVFSDYGWGGYLIWKYPEKKVFIDGRMPSWKWEANKVNESNYAMKDYLDITQGKEDYSGYFQKYNIDIVLLPANRPEGVFMQIQKKLSGRFKYLSRILGGESKKFNLRDKLEASGWIKVYEDKKSEIYQKSQ